MLDVYKTIQVKGQDFHIPQRVGALQAKEKRSDLYRSNEDIENRDWDKLLEMPQEGGLIDLWTLYDDMIKEVRTNKPWPKKLEECGKQYLLHDEPKIFCEYGFGHTTYVFLDWCIRNDGYLVTVEMPIAHSEYVDQENFPELYYFGVDRYHTKYRHALRLRRNPVSHKRWLWINDDIYTITRRILFDQAYREKLFLNGKIDYFYEDAIHDDEFLVQLWKDIRPYMRVGGVFTGDDNCPTHLV